jgi:hypothetical protein
MTQANVSRIERTENLYLRTLADCLGALGGSGLELHSVGDASDRVSGSASSSLEPLDGRSITADQPFRSPFYSVGIGNLSCNGIEKGESQ